MSAALAHALKAEARRLGFDYVGIAQAAVLHQEAADLAAFMAEGRHGTMDWLARDPVARADPQSLLPGCQSVIAVLKNYHPGATEVPTDTPRISTYAWGEDYHRVLKDGLYQLAGFLTQLAGPAHQHRPCVDSAPILEKAWARRAGLGWIGKHTNLIVPSGGEGPGGSWFFIGILLTTVPLPADDPFITDHCGTCTRCLDACPTQALTPYQMDARRCISYLTIEHQGEVALDTHGWTYGCDICQEVCPWNRFAQAHDEPRFAPLPHTRLTVAEWAALPTNQYKRLTAPTAMRRVPKRKLLQNLQLAHGEFPQPGEEVLPSLRDF